MKLEMYVVILQILITKGWITYQNWFCLWEADNVCGND